MTYIPSRILIIALILLSICFPLPGGHSHQGMAETELATHLRLYHVCDHSPFLLRSWHSHSSLPLPISGSINAFPVVEESEADCKKRLNQQNQFESGSLRRILCNVDGKSASQTTSIPIHHLSERGCPLFMQLNVQLI